MAVVTLGLGSNLGDRLANLQQAIDRLTAHGVRAIASSRVWETEPVGGPEGQPAFLNAVALADAGDLDPEDVLGAANAVEGELGRTRDVHHGPRTIDIDILLIDDLTRDHPSLTIPHPRLTERAFVILPMLDVVADPVLPDGTRVRDLPLTDAAARPYAPPLRLP